mgnify:FL=1
MEFTEFKGLIQAHFKKITEGVSNIFTVDVDKDEFWNTYLDSFPAGTNNIYRERREHDCCYCRHFIKSIGNVVAIKDNKIISLWDFEINDTTYTPVTKALSNYIHSHAISDIFLSAEKFAGTEYNFELLDNGKSKQWDHFYLDIPESFVHRNKDLINENKATYRDTRNVFKRSLDEITQEAVETILELISQNSLYKGEEWKAVLEKFLKYKKEYSKLTTPEDKDIYTWNKTKEAGMSIGRIRNHSIGTLLVDISNNIDLDVAVGKFEAMVAPANYRRPKAIFTKKMLEDAKNTVTELGYIDSLKRRFATLDDITVNNILFSNRDASKRIEGADIFDEMKNNIPVNTKKFSKVEEVTIEDFVNNILPTAKSIEALVENKHKSNFVSLIAPEVKDSKTMFKWNNNFSWSYTGNITDSMKERVKAAGGKVDGDLRFSIQWNEDGTDNCDLDAHCKEADGFKIYYGSAKKPCYSNTKGQLDIDIINPDGKVAVENITWSDRKTMKDGKYIFFVNQFSGSAKKGFRAEIEFDGQIFAFDYNNSMRTKENVMVAEVTLKNGIFSIKECLPSEQTSREVWGINTNQFIPVSVVMYSPNYWDEQIGVGNKHYFFMLKDCINSESPHGFYNEFLNNSLDKHKRVFEALGGKMSAEDTNDQLSGLGFSSTLRNELIVKVIGVTERVIKIKF